MNVPDITKISGLRDRAVLSVLLGCGLRRAELVLITVDHIQKRDKAWVLANLVGKRNKIRTVVIPQWTKKVIAAYTSAVGISEGYLIRPSRRNGKLTEGSINPRTVARIVKKYSKGCGISNISPHDLCRTYAKLAYKNGAKLDQIQINLGHQSLTTTQKYLGIDLDLNDGPGSYLDIKVD